MFVAVTYDKSCACKLSCTSTCYWRILPASVICVHKQMKN